MSKDNPFSGPVETTFEYCSVCDAEHSMLESAERKKEREDKIEIWDKENKIWVKKADYYNAV